MDENQEIEQSLENELDAELSTNSEEQIEDVETSEIEDDSADDTESEYDEVELDGEKYKVPSKIKEAILRHEDYTRKTQEVAETRKQIESERAVLEQERQLAAQSFQRQQANFEAHAKLASLNEQLSAYEQADWTSLSNQDPVEAQKLFMQFSQLKDAKAKLAGYISQSEQQATQERQQHLARAIEQGHAQLTKEIPNWNASLAKEVSASAVNLGFSESELNQIIDPRHVKALYYAKIGYEAMQKAKAKPTGNVTPLKTVKASSDSNKVDPEKMSIDEWTKWRERQLNRKG